MAQSQHSVRRHLRLRIDEYDVAIRRFAPGYDAMQFAVAREIAQIQPRLVLDLGGGTGSLTEVLFEHTDVGTIDLIDVDPEMLDQARTRLAPYGKRVHFREMSFLSELPRCDSVVTSLALHHIETQREKTSLYRRIHNAIRPGGFFVNADVTMPAGAAEQQQTYEQWTNHMIGCGITKMQAQKHLEEWAAEDTYFPVGVELAALESVGFRSECVWRQGPMAVMLGRKEHSRLTG